jgi:hypothetical protein
MSDHCNTKKQCVTCNKSGGVLICDGCQKIFCGKHVIEHRQELGAQLDGIMQEHDLLQQELGQLPLTEHSTLKQIDKWEKESMVKIQAAAATARMNLRQSLEQSKERLSKTCCDMAETLRASREADDYSEHDLAGWAKQLEKLKLEIKLPSSAKLVEDKNSPIFLIVSGSIDSGNKQSTKAKESTTPPPTASSSNSTTQERFLQVSGSVILADSGYLAECAASRLSFAYIRGRCLYSKGCFTVRFRIEQSSKPYCIFFGCMSSEGKLKKGAFKSQHAVGWFGSDQVYEHGYCATNCAKYGYYSTSIRKNDELHLILDCDKKQIRLFNEREKSTCTLSVKNKLAPFPWQFLVVLCNVGDSVRILSNA